jgi:hypothetical protein
MRRNPRARRLHGSLVGDAFKAWHELRMIGTKTSEKEISLEKIRQFIDR